MSVGKVSIKHISTKSAKRYSLLNLAYENKSKLQFLSITVKERNIKERQSIAYIQSNFAAEIS